MKTKYSKSYIDKELRELEKLQDLFNKRYDILKKELQHKSDISDSFYNRSLLQVKSATEIYKENVRRGKINKQYRQYKRQLKYYSTTPTNLISSKISKTREERWLERLENISKEDLERGKELLNMLTEEDKKEFFKSNFFFINRKKDSEEYIQFLNEHTYSVEIAKLEDFMNQKGYKVEQTFNQKENKDEEK